MTDRDFDIASLAAYLHLSAAQVSELAERGKIPARRVAGQWRFSPAEVHHWLEGRIGASNDEELADMEDVLQRSPGPSARPQISIARMLPLAGIAVPLDARGARGSVITSMADLAAHTGLVWDAPKLAEAVRAREDLLPTAQDIGVALLHPRRPMPGILAEPLVALGRTERRIPFGGTRGAMVDLFFLICSVDDRTHLQTLARLSRLVGDAEFLSHLRQAPDALAVRQLIEHAEANLPA